MLLPKFAANMISTAPLAVSLFEKYFFEIKKKIGSNVNTATSFVKSIDDINDKVNNDWINFLFVLERLITISAKFLSIPVSFKDSTINIRLKSVMITFESIKFNENLPV